MALSMRVPNVIGNRVACRPERSVRSVVCKAEKNSLGQVAAATLVASSLLAGSANALTYDQLQGLTYTQVKGSGIAATCPVIEAGTTDPRVLKAGDYNVNGFCMEPSSIEIKAPGPRGEERYEPTSLVTRATYKLNDMTGKMKIGSDGKVEFKELDGMDFAASSVIMPGGEPEQFLFTIKQFEGKGTFEAFAGNFVVPSYRGTTYMDPGGRGAANGYEMAIQLAASGDSDDLVRWNKKVFAPGKGYGVFSVAKVDAETGKIGGIFETVQPANTEMGAKEPKDVKITGLWYAQLEAE